MRTWLTCSVVLLLLFALSDRAAKADIIDFEAQGAGRGGLFTGIPDSPLVIGIATFTGGELLNMETFSPADETAVYATTDNLGSGYTNPLVITFSQPVSNFTILVVNGQPPQDYTVADNLGASQTINLMFTGAATFMLPGSGITSVTITAPDFPTVWDFSIDNVTFSTSTPSPEPASLLLFGTGLAVLMRKLRKRLA
jgi:PEP-CTERM motif